MLSVKTKVKMDAAESWGVTALNQSQVTNLVSVITSLQHVKLMLHILPAKLAYHS